MRNVGLAFRGGYKYAKRGRGMRSLGRDWGKCVFGILDLRRRTAADLTGARTAREDGYLHCSQL